MGKIFNFCFIKKEDHEEVIYVSANSTVDAWNKVKPIVSNYDCVQLVELPQYDTIISSEDICDLYEVMYEVDNELKVVLYPVKSNVDFDEIMKLNPVSVQLFTEKTKLI